jgi:hypothetical protein
MGQTGRPPWAFIHIVKGEAMKHSQNVGKHCLTCGTLLAAIFLAGCGGGGSYGGSGGSAVTAADAVTVGPATPSSIRATKRVGEKMDNVDLRGGLSGNVDSLQNAAVYALVEDPDGLFGQQAVVVLQRGSAGYNYTVNLVGQTLTRSGHFAGNLRLFACLDTQCKQPLAGTPQSIPYDVTVTP